MTRLIRNTTEPIRCDWPDGTFIQGGARGVVLGGKDGPYRTAFVEAFPADTFLRGEGPTIEYAVAALGVKHVIVCGHTRCGAMGALVHPEYLQGLPLVASFLAHAEVHGAMDEVLQKELIGALLEVTDAQHEAIGRLRAGDEQLGPCRRRLRHGQPRPPAGTGSATGSGAGAFAPLAATSALQRGSSADLPESALSAV